MAVDIREIELTEEQKRRIAELADKTGRPWREVLDEQLAAPSDTDAGQGPSSSKDPFIRDRKERMDYFRKWVAQQTSHNPNFDDSRESIYFGRE